jgi:hypothetical protein
MHDRSPTQFAGTLASGSREGYGRCVSSEGQAGATGGSVEAAGTGRPRTWIGRLWKPASEPHVVLVGLEEGREAKAAATGAALAHVLSRPDSIRQRAQNAATISSAVAAALVIAALSQLAGGEEDFRRGTFIACGFAVFFWLCSVGFFVFAVTFVSKNVTAASDDVPNVDVEASEGYQELVRCYELYADDVRAKMRVAAVSSFLAMVAAAFAVTFEVAEFANSTDKRMQFILTRNGAASIDALCDWGGKASATTPVVGNVAADEMNDTLLEVSDVVLLDAPKSKKGAACIESGIDVRLPRSVIRVSREVPG